MSDTCTTCGLPTELCLCEDVEKSGSIVTLDTEERQYGKEVTLVSGVEGDIDVSDLASRLKSNLACGGTVQDDGSIMLQGHHVKRAADLLENEGFVVEIVAK